MSGWVKNEGNIWLPVSMDSLLHGCYQNSRKGMNNFFIGDCVKNRMFESVLEFDHLGEVFSALSEIRKFLLPTSYETNNSSTCMSNWEIVEVE